jgi:hypothetical protein
MNDGYIIIPALFFLLGFIFLGIQIRKEYHWMRSLGDISTLFDTADDI